MSLAEQIMTDMKTAMKSRDKVKLNTVRMIKAALMNEKIEVGHELTPDEELTILNREKKQREESIAEFEKAKRDDLVDETRSELRIIESYLPEQLSEQELQKIVKESIDEVHASNKADFGKVMKVIMPKIKGRADGKMAANAVKAQLS
ncbi:MULTISPECIES: GatB/YqeY domain-containing protein [unclassified Lactobacillus]|uniref:GatB/YqeY domain-containing protein n=1 Tax=unclassified Lactobacillus TaxID=2620435 RepID=UPI000EFD870C|nr:MULTISPECIES: GatB/YqeY domain-containing protein [unclassified Lactobacillus]RMC24351.1 GatB/YqeY domain-containing protein [Lactobacillus sp. ESL0247]RMC28490.1 GatB/YqeY domain-containing protein [Lactobacillus sp. ESL0246]RMC31681.1 GatB/YqeY domain-containing protein [Lactobacillus sp. ESL0245]RMC48834.1 GatB/YqeY domain-containing protein [Lactobacillus sp. ESL0228]